MQQVHNAKEAARAFQDKVDHVCHAEGDPRWLGVLVEIQPNGQMMFHRTTSGFPVDDIPLVAMKISTMLEKIHSGPADIPAPVLPPLPKANLNGDFHAG